MAAMANPAAVYCVEMGYEYQLREDDEFGQTGVCIFNENQQCDAWAFLVGQCGQAFSYCARQGYDIRTVNDGRNPFSPEYAVCLSRHDRQPAGAVTELFDLSEKTQGSGCTFEPESTAESLVIQEGERLHEGAPAAQPLSLPSSFDWRSTAGGNWDTPVKDQGIAEVVGFGTVSKSVFL